MGEIEARRAETSEKPADFVNASPFPNRQEEKDTSRLRSWRQRPSRSSLSS
jgi:hypothetical protein